MATYADVQPAEGRWRVAPGERPPSLHWDEANPHIRQIFDYWSAIAPPGLLPGRQHIDPCDIPPRLLPHVMLIDVLRDGAGACRFRYRLVGTALVDAIGQEVTGRFVDEFEQPGQRTTSRDLSGVVSERLVSWRRGHPRLSHTAEFKLLERLHLPLARDGRTVDMVLNFAVFY